MPPGRQERDSRMNVTYIHHSSFLVETERFYYLFDYAKGRLPEMDPAKPVYVLASHSHGDHFNPEVFSLLAEAGMQQIHALLSDDIHPPADTSALLVSPEMEYALGEAQKLTTLRSTDLGVAFLIEDRDALIYHAGDLNDWVWDEESEADNAEMTENYRAQIALLAETLRGRTIDVAFVVLDPRQEGDYHRGLVWFLEKISAKRVYPMHYWGESAIIQRFLADYPQYKQQIQITE